MVDGLGLGDAYGETLDRIKGQGGEKSRLGMATLMWISHAEQPLNPDELCHAMAVEIGSPNLNPDNVPSIGTLLACCQGLIFVDNLKEASRVQLIHFTLQEYLRAHPELFGAPYSIMAETCLSYLNSQQVKVLSTSPPLDLQSTPFLQYSSLYWGAHAKRDLSDCAKSLALKLFNDSKNHISTKILLGAQEPWYAIDFDKIPLFSGLHCASIFGIVEIVACLVDQMTGQRTRGGQRTPSTKPLYEASFLRSHWVGSLGHERKLPFAENLCLAFVVPPRSLTRHLVYTSPLPHLPPFNNSIPIMQAYTARSGSCNKPSKLQYLIMTTIFYVNVLMQPIRL